MNQGQPGFDAASSSPTDDLQIELQVGQRLQAIDQQLKAIDQQLKAIYRQNKRQSRKLRRQLRRTDRQLRTATTQNENVLQRLSTLEFRANNADIRAGNSRLFIQPLIDVRTGAIIPNCPTTSEEVMELSMEEADRILLALQTPVTQGATGTFADKLEAVRLALLP
jgi:hypothetical protein